MSQDSIARTYDPKKVIVTFGGVTFFGYADGAFIHITQNGDSFEKVKGADGSVDRVNKNARDYSIKITLKKTSPTNDALSLIAISDKINNDGKMPLGIVDLNGTSLFFAPECWIKKMPDAEESSNMPHREWDFDTGIADNFIGGELS